MPEKRTDDMDAKFKNKILAWRERIGYSAALEALIISGISKSCAQKLLLGAYEPRPKQLLLNAIESAMKKGA